jgi:spermidine synthase
VDRSAVTARERAILLVSVLIISICALTYELIVATLSSYLLGNSITQFSITIGVFLFAMGVGAALSRRVRRNELRWFIVVELLTGLFGGLSAAVLYAVFATTEFYYYTVMITLILALGTCIGLEIPLLMRIVADRASLSKALADVLSIDYLGALIGSLAFPLLLLPILGVTPTAYLMGIFNILVAAMCLAMFRPRLSRGESRVLWGSSIGIIAVLVVGAATSQDFVHFFEQQLYEDHIIFREQTQYQRIIMSRGGEDLRLFLDGNLQFSSRDEYRYHELLVHPVMSAARNRETVLILGGGDGLGVREVLKYPDVKRVILVDLDPAMTDLARDFPTLQRMNGDALADPRVEVVNTDAYKYIENSSDIYPVIIIDLPDPNNESLSKLYSQTFYRLLRERLAPDGAFITQATSPYFARSAFWCIANTIRASDFHILPLRTYVPSFGEWGWVIGTPNRPPEVSVPDVQPLRYLSPDVLAASLVFDPDVAQIDTPINTLDNPTLPRLYEESWRQWD